MDIVRIFAEFLQNLTSSGGGRGYKNPCLRQTEIEVFQDLSGGGGNHRRDLSAPVILAHDINAFKIYLY